jgi:hypothetical protein
MKNLLHLKIDGGFSSSISDENIQNICLNLRRLRQLELSGCGVNDESLKELKNLVNLEIFIASGNKISDSGIEHVFFLRSNV